MKTKLLFILILSFITASTVAAQQSRTVTNEDLEKFRQKRLAAERDLRENYQRLGFPSPEELEKQIEQSRIERSELAERLRAENLETERLDLERQRAEREARNFNLQNQNYSPRSSDEYLYNYPWSGGGFFSFPNSFYRNNYYNRRGNFGRGNRSFNNQPRIEYRNNIPVRTPAPARPVFSPR